MKHTVAVNEYLITWGPAVAATLAGAGAALIVWWQRRRASYPVDRLGLEYDIAYQRRTRRTQNRQTHAAKSLPGIFLADAPTVERLQQLAGQNPNAAALRLRQVTVGCALALLALALGTASLAVAKLHFGQLLVAVVAAAMSGYLLPAYRLRYQAKKRQTQLQRELPDVIELLALCVGAGENLHGALERIAQRCSQVSGEVFGRAVIRLGMGLSLPEVLQEMRRENEAPLLHSLVGALLTAIERGTPLAGVLQDQAGDSRASQRAQMLELGGSKEIWMMVPVVFLILPLTVVFALYPGLVALRF